VPILNLWTIDSLVLEHLILRFEGHGEKQILSEDLVIGDVGPALVPASLRRLHKHGLIEGSSVDEVSHPIILFGVTKDGLERAGSWPTPEGVPDQLVRLLQAAAQQTDDPEEKTLLQRTAGVVGGSLREVVVGLMIAQGGS